jgi:tRNA-2-methylthio-N6-dimethylallyladenosine synthase
MSNTVNDTGRKKLFIKTWGCQMNVYDSKRMADVLAPMGYDTIEEPDGADMIILNTCHIREKATDKVFSELGRLRKHKKAKEAEGKSMIMAVAGCVAQAEGDFILERAKDVDMVFGPQSYHELPEMVLRAGGERVVNIDFPAESKFDRLPEENLNPGPAAFLSVQEGCDKFCSFCVVPYTRGSEYSRSVVSVLDEAKRMVGQGARELTLLGQNVNAYHGEADGKTWSLADLIASLADIGGLERIRYTTSHPNDMQDDLIDAHASIEKLMPYLHLPVQAGSDKILKAMNRKHTAASYLAIIDKVRKARPDISLSGDFIVGFPGETEEDFEATLQIVKDAGYASAYSFKYSPRPGTPASAMQGLLRENIKSERLERLQALISSQQLAFNQRTVGLTLPVLFERVGGRDGQLQGRTPYNQSINVPANARLMGQIVPVKVTDSFTNSLVGEVETIEMVVKSA